MRKIILLSLISAILVSCGTSNSVVNDGLFQKRKYTSGWFIKKKKGVEKKSANEENLALEEVEKEFPKKEQSSTSKKETNDLSHVVEKKKSITTDEASALDKTSSNSNTSKRDRKKGIVSNTKENEKAKNSAIAIEEFGHEEQTHKKEVVNQDKSRSSSGDLEIILLVLLAFILPPLAVYLVQDTSTMFVVDLILFLIGWSSFWFFSLGGLAALAAVVIALLVVFGVL